MKLLPVDYYVSLFLVRVFGDWFLVFITYYISKVMTLQLFEKSKDFPTVIQKTNTYIFFFGTAAISGFFLQNLLYEFDEFNKIFLINYLKFFFAILISSFFGVYYGFKKDAINRFRKNQNDW